MREDVAVMTMSAAGLDFLAARQLATLTTMRPDGTPHVTPVGFTFDPGRGLARVICDQRSRKAANVANGGRAALCQVDGRDWLTLEGPAAVRSDAEAVEEAVRRYAQRYRIPRANPTRVVIEVDVRRCLGTMC